jgi:bifunctional DNA-binding transcriptional regulator/antitoxin component of YhaV-PrlF toxin-antitoxin module
MEEENITIRKVQAYTGEKSLTIVLPRYFTAELGIGKGDFLKVLLRGKQLILEKADI